MSGIKYIGIIGWNEHTKILANNFHFQTKGTEILAIAAHEPEAQKYAREVLGLKHVFTDPHLLYELHQLNAVCIQSSGEYHLDQVTKCLAAGVDILIDLPMASNVSDCRVIEKQARSHPSQKSMVLFPRRYNPELQRIKKLMAEEKLGNIISINVNSYEALPANHHESPSAASKGIFMDVTLQDIDMVRWLTESEFTSVYAKGSAEQYPSLKRHNDADTAIIAAQMDKGLLVSFFSTRAGNTSDGFDLHILGTKGELRYDSRKTQIDLLGIGAEELKGAKVDYTDYKSGLRYFSDGILLSNRFEYGLDIGTAATKVAVAMTKSFILGNEVDIENK